MIRTIYKSTSRPKIRLSYICENCADGRMQIDIKSIIMWKFAGWYTIRYLTFMLFSNFAALEQNIVALSKEFRFNYIPKYRNG